MEYIKPYALCSDSYENNCDGEAVDFTWTEDD
jgi:hypothetical protein